VEKKPFKDAKEAEQRFLEECLKEVIQCFINRSQRFMSAYCKRLTGAAAAWAVCKQKQHQAINQMVMIKGWATEHPLKSTHPMRSWDFSRG
jgi:hypothetical protein